MADDGTDELNEMRQRYITLLKKALRNSLYSNDKHPTKADLGQMWLFKRYLKIKYRKYPALVGLTLSPRQLYYTKQGNLLPAHTLGSQANVDNVHFCTEAVIREGVPGDLLEAGVFRGGQSILMKGILDAWGETDRKVILADSFEGLPTPDPSSDMDDVLAHEMLGRVGAFAASLATVKENFDRYGLLDDRVVFVKGWFNQSLPTAPIDKLAIMRLDADYYESTMDALTNLYPKLSVGGWVILDDYGHPMGCRTAVNEFREANGIEDPIQMADDHVGFWQRTA
jgi:O-methyltransferase